MDNFTNLFCFFLFFKKLVPEDVLAKVAVPSIDSITSHHIERYNTETDKQHPKLDVKNMPIFTYLDHVITDFVYVSSVFLFYRIQFYTVLL